MARTQRLPFDSAQGGAGLPGTERRDAKGANVWRAYGAPKDETGKPILQG